MAYMGRTISFRNKCYQIQSNHLVGDVAKYGLCARRSVDNLLCLDIYQYEPNPIGAPRFNFSNVSRGKYRWIQIVYHRYEIVELIAHCLRLIRMKLNSTPRSRRITLANSPLNHLILSFCL